MLRRFIGGIGNPKAGTSYLNSLNESVVRRLFFGLFGKMPSHPTDKYLDCILTTDVLLYLLLFFWYCSSYERSDDDFDASYLYYMHPALLMYYCKWTEHCINQWMPILTCTFFPTKSEREDAASTFDPGVWETGQTFRAIWSNCRIYCKGSRLEVERKSELGDSVWQGAFWWNPVPQQPQDLCLDSSFFATREQYCFWWW